MHQILSSTPMLPTDGHIDGSFRERSGWADSMGATVLAMLLGDEGSGPMVVFSYVEPSDEQMPLSFAHAHASDSWRISLQGTTDMGRDAYPQGRFRFHDGGVPYASDNFAWGPDGGYGMIVFADRRGFAIRPVKPEIAERVVPEQEATGALLGIDLRDPCPGAPAIATTLGPTRRAHLDGGFDETDRWDEITPGVRVAVGLAGDPTAGPVLVLVDADADAELLPRRTVASETLVVPVGGSAHDDGGALALGDLRVEEADARHPALVAGPDGAQLVALFADRRALGAAVDAGDVAGSLGRHLATRLPELEQRIAATPTA